MSHLLLLHLLHPAFVQPRNRVWHRPFVFRLSRVYERIGFGHEATFGVRGDDMHDLREPLVGPALRVLHDTGQPVPEVLVAVSLAGNAVAGESMLARRETPFQDGFIREKRAIVDAL